MYIKGSNIAEKERVSETAQKLNIYYNGRVPTLIPTSYMLTYVCMDEPAPCSWVGIICMEIVIPAFSIACKRGRCKTCVSDYGGGRAATESE